MNDFFNISELVCYTVHTFSDKSFSDMAVKKKQKCSLVSEIERQGWSKAG